MDVRGDTSAAVGNVEGNLTINYNGNGRSESQPEGEIPSSEYPLIGERFSYGDATRTRLLRPVFWL